jgi:hypothetical protein
MKYTVRCIDHNPKRETMMVARPFGESDQEVVALAQVYQMASAAAAAAPADSKVKVEVRFCDPSSSLPHLLLNRLLSQVLSNYIGGKFVPPADGNLHLHPAPLATRRLTPWCGDAQASTWMTRTLPPMR